MVVILESDEAERLQYSGRRLPHGRKDLRHAAHGAGLRLKRQFHEGTVSKRMLQLQKASGYGNGLKFSFGAAAIF